MSLTGATAGWAEAGNGTVAARPAASTAASAVPSVARFIELRVIMLASSHRNERDTVAAGDANDRTDRLAGHACGRIAPGRGIVALPAGDAAALETRDVAAHRIGRVGVGGLGVDREQHAA